MLDSTLLTPYINTFYGYGTYTAPYWFVGMEEGGGNSLDEVAERITRWHKRGQPELRDPRGYNFDPSTSTSPWFGPNPRAQTTWKQLIRILLVAEGRPSSLQEIKAYQRDHMGSLDGETCLLELLPLPSPSTWHWHYREYASLLPQLGTRADYMTHYAPSRAAHLKKQVSQHTPKVVVFYSFNWWYRQWWDLIAGVPFAPKDASGGNNVLLGANSTTKFAIVKHPASRGISNRYYDDAGKLLLSLPLSPGSRS